MVSSRTLIRASNLPSSFPLPLASSTTFPPTPLTPCSITLFQTPCDYERDIQKFNDVRRRITRPEHRRCQTSSYIPVLRTIIPLSGRTLINLQQSKRHGIHSIDHQVGKTRRCATGMLRTRRSIRWRVSHSSMQSSSLRFPVPMIFDYPTSVPYYYDIN